MVAWLRFGVVVVAVCILCVCLHACVCVCEFFFCALKCFLNAGWFDAMMLQLNRLFNEVDAFFVTRLWSLVSSAS